MCEPSPAAYAAAAAKVEAAGAPRPPNEPDWRRFIEVTARERELDAVMIVTPHAFHFAQAERGARGRARRPAREADGHERDRGRRAHPHPRPDRAPARGRRSRAACRPHVRAASTMIRSGELGAILNINAVVWQDWQDRSRGTWREDPVLSGGGFMFDTGAHLLNTVADLAGEDVVQVAAWLEDDGSPVDIRAAVIARLGVRGADHDERLRPCDPVARLRHPRVLRARRRCGPGSGASASSSSATARRPCGRSARCGPTHGVAAVRRRAGRAHGQPEPARGRPAHGAAVGRDPRVVGDAAARW